MAWDGGPLEIARRQPRATHCRVGVWPELALRYVRLSEAPAHGQHIFEYDPRCAGDSQYFGCGGGGPRGSHEGRVMPIVNGH